LSAERTLTLIFTNLDVKLRIPPADQDVLLMAKGIAAYLRLLLNRSDVVAEDVEICRLVYGQKRDDLAAFELLIDASPDRLRSRVAGKSP